jgi:amino acid transporter
LKIVKQSLIVSLVAHILYILGTVVVGYLNAKSYSPDIMNSYQKTELLQNNIAFGFINPLFFLLSFIVLTVICGLVLFLYKKIFNPHRRT